MAADEDSEVRGRAASVLGEAFSQVPDKTLAWQDLHRLMGDEDSSVRWRAANALGEAFSQFPDKKLAGQDLHKLMRDEDSKVRLETASALRVAFRQVTGKNLVWQDLLRLVGDEGLREVSASEILDKIKKGEPIEYDRIIIKGDLDIRIEGFDLAPIRRALNSCVNIFNFYGRF